MFELWKLNRQLRAHHRSYKKHRNKLLEEKARSDEVDTLDAEEYFTGRDIEREIDAVVGSRLIHETRSVDVEIPPLSDKDMWFFADDGRRVWFTPKGRAHVRKLIDEEKGRRFEATTRSVKLWLPIISALAGLLGVITGLVAVLRK
jgi:hypothetical protein